jgi:hypothetical protein
MDVGTVCSPTSNDSNGDWDLTNSTTIIWDGEAATIKSFDGHTLVFEFNLGNNTILSETLYK